MTSGRGRAHGVPLPRGGVDLRVAHPVPLAVQDVVAQLHVLEEPENTDERRFGKLLQVYLGVRTVEGRPLLSETYQPYDAISTASSRDVAGEPARAGRRPRAAVRRAGAPRVPDGGAAARRAGRARAAARQLTRRGGPRSRPTCTTGSCRGWWGRATPWTRRRPAGRGSRPTRCTAPWSTCAAGCELRSLIVTPPVLHSQGLQLTGRPARDGGGPRRRARARRRGPAAAARGHRWSAVDTRAWRACWRPHPRTPPVRSACSPSRLGLRLHRRREPAEHDAGAHLGLGAQRSCPSARSCAARWRCAPTAPTSPCCRAVAAARSRSRRRTAPPAASSSRRSRPAPP